MRRRAVFDLDGTLIDSAPLCAALLNMMLARRGAGSRVSEAGFRPFASLGGRAMVAALLADAAGDPDADVAEFRGLYAETPTPEACLYPGVREGLMRLADEGVMLGLCSNKPQALCEKVLDDLGLAPLFGRVVGARPGVPLKPDPALLYLALDGRGRGAAHDAYIGDSPLDYEVGRRADVDCILVTWGYGDFATPLAGATLARAFDEVVRRTTGRGRAARGRAFA